MFGKIKSLVLTVLFSIDIRPPIVTPLVEVARHDGLFGPAYGSSSVKIRWLLSLSLLSAQGYLGIALARCWCAINYSFKEDNIELILLLYYSGANKDTKTKYIFTKCNTN